jgi:hypothetical protein
VFKIGERISVTSQKGGLCPDNHFARNSNLIIKIGEAVSETKRAYGETYIVELIILLCVQKTRRNYLARKTFRYLQIIVWHELPGNTFVDHSSVFFSQLR